MFPGPGSHLVLLQLARAERDQKCVGRRTGTGVLSCFTVFWNVIEAGVAIVAGVIAGIPASPLSSRIRYLPVTTKGIPASLRKP